MLEREFECLVLFIAAAGPLEAAEIVRKFERVTARAVELATPDNYTRDALEGARDGVSVLVHELSQEHMNRFTRARARYGAREAILAFQDEWLRQLQRG